jgi:NAD+ kinase
MKIAIHGRSLNPVAAPAVRKLMNDLERMEIPILLSEQWSRFVEEVGWSFGHTSVFESREDLTGVDYFFSIGGDGTLLDCVALIGDLEIPIVGINAGRLGFLATTQEEAIPTALEYLFAKRYTLDDRALIRVNCEQTLFEGINFGLNEVSVLKADVSAMITVHTYLNGEYLNSYWADGLIIATPTGSTGYSLSCGGPLVLPQSANFVITPVSPHNLTVRPMVVSDKSIITLEVECRAQSALISVDSRSQVIPTGKPLTIRREKFNARLVKFEGYSFFNTLRQKLNWGLDARN